MPLVLRPKSRDEFWCPPPQTFPHETRGWSRGDVRSLRSIYQPSLSLSLMTVSLFTTRQYVDF